MLQGLLLCSSSFLLFGGSQVVYGSLYYDSDGNVLSGDSLMEECQVTKKVNTDFSKNVYASNSPAVDREWTPLLFPEFYDQFDSDQTCGKGSKFMDMTTCSQIHSPMTPAHAEGDMTVAYVQEQYTAKWRNLRESKQGIYDSFLDNSIAYWVDDLSIYQKHWSKIGADIVYLKWSIKNEESLGRSSEREKLEGGKTYYSLITHNGNEETGSTLTQYEIISDEFTNLDEIMNDINIVESEQRVFFDSTTNYRAASKADVTASDTADTTDDSASSESSESTSSSDSTDDDDNKASRTTNLKTSTGSKLLPIGIRRAVTSVDENVDWYLKIFSASIIDPSTQVVIDTAIDYAGNTVKYAHIKLYPSDESTTISFFERSGVESTYGEFKVLDFESGMTNTHNDNMMSPFCGIDRWFDMHYALSFDSSTEAAEKVLETMMNSGEKYTLYGQVSTTFVYMPEPNGHSVQLIFSDDSEISFITTPETWRADWCPIECTDEQASYTYGDRVAYFRWDDEYKNNLLWKNDIVNKEKSGLNLFFVIGVALTIAASIVIMAMCDFNPCKWNVVNNVEYTKIPN